MATVTIKSRTSAALSWVIDDGASTGPKRGTGANGGNVNQILLHEGVNSNVTQVGVLAAIAAAKSSGFEVLITP